MSVATLIYATLGPLVGNRVYPNTWPQAIPEFSNWPAIRYSIISSDSEATICGTDTVATDNVRVQIDIVALTYSAAASLRDAVISALIGLSSPPCARVGLFEEYDEETKTHRVSLDVMFYQSS